MKKIMFLMLLLLAATTSWSQGNRQRPEPPSIEERLDQAREQLTLTEDQLTEWKAIFEKYDDQIQKARENRDRESGESLRAALNEELMATLNEDQQEKFKTMQKNRPQRGRRRG